jgi:hypothetical protein
LLWFVEGQSGYELGVGAPLGATAEIRVHHGLG